MMNFTPAILDFTIIDKPVLSRKEHCIRCLAVELITCTLTYRLFIATVDYVEP